MSLPPPPPSPPLESHPSQGPKLTFLGRRQLVTEFFFKPPYGKMWSPKSVNKECTWPLAPTIHVRMLRETDGSYLH